MALTKPFAENGDKKAIPQTTSDGSVSFNNGFGSLYALPPEEGGLFIDRAQFNQLMFDTTSQVLENKQQITAQTNRINEVNNLVNTKANQATTYNKTEVNNLLNAKANQSTTYNKTEVDDRLRAYSYPREETYNRDQFHSLLSSVSRSTYSKREVDNLLGVKANWDHVVRLTDDQTINGVKTFTSNITAPNITTMQNNLNTIFSPTSSPVKTQTTTKIITVGSGGDFQDLLSAINEARKYTSPVEIKLVSNLQINQTLRINNINGSHIIINFQNYKITNTSSQDVQILMQCSNIGNFHNLNLENISFYMAVCSITSLTGTININKNLLTDNISAIDVIQLSLLHIAYNVVLTVNSSTNNNLILSQTGSIISIAGNVTINSTKNTGNLFSIYNGGILVLHNNITINKPSGLNLYNTAINTPSGNGLIFKY